MNVLWVSGDVCVFFFKQKTAYEISACLVGSEMCIRDRTTRVSNLMLRSLMHVKLNFVQGDEY